MEYRQLVMDFKIGYKDDIDQARSIILGLFKNHESVLQERGLQVVVTTQGEQLTNLSARAWTRSGDFWTVHFYMNEQVKKEFDQAGIGVPFRQLGVHFPGELQPELLQKEQN